MDRTSKNNITGDKLISKPSSEKYRANWDKIFSNKKPKRIPAMGEGDLENEREIAEWHKRKQKVKEGEQEKGRVDQG
jgi:hypothetical protein